MLSWRWNQIHKWLGGFQKQERSKQIRWIQKLDCWLCSWFPKIIFRRRESETAHELKGVLFTRFELHLSDMVERSAMLLLVVLFILFYIIYIFCYSFILCFKSFFCFSFIRKCVPFLFLLLPNRNIDFLREYN